jgi:hypothetical protein
MFSDFYLTLIKTGERYNIIDLQGAVTQTVPIDEVSALVATPPADEAVIGQGLYDLLLADTSFSTQRDAAPVRLIINLERAPELAQLPWELLHDGERYLGLADDVSLLRMSVRQGRSLAIDPLPVRVLLTSVSADDPMAAEEEAIWRSVAQRSGGVIELTTMREITRLRFFREFNEAGLRGEPFHVWHHLGSAEASSGQVHLQFADVSAAPEQFAHLFHTSTHLKLVSLNLRHGGQAAALAAFRTPVIVGNTANVDDVGRIGFFRTFYEHVFTRGIAQATQQARRAASVLGDQSWAKFAVEITTDHDALLPQAAPATARPVGEARLSRDQVFISYSHLDRLWLDELVQYMEPLRRNHTVNMWSDRDIHPGADWLHEIETALARAKVAVLLASPAFLSSSFIMERELPAILEAHGRGDLTVIWFAVKAYMYEMTPLNSIQAAHDPAYPLDRLDETAKQDVLMKVVRRVAEALNC